MTGGASRTARLQYLSAPEPGGRQSRNRHDVNDPLLLALQKGEQPPVGAGLSVAAATVSTVGAEKNGMLPTNGKVLGDLVEVRKKCPPQATVAMKRERRLARTDKYYASSGKENVGQTTVREARGKLVDELHDEQPRASSCRDNLPRASGTATPGDAATSGCLRRDCRHTVTPQHLWRRRHAC